VRGLQAEPPLYTSAWGRRAAHSGAEQHPGAAADGHHSEVQPHLLPQHTRLHPQYLNHVSLSKYLPSQCG